LVDHQKETQQAAYVLLSKMGLKVDIALSGSEALRKFCEYSYDIIFMELAIPELDGFEVTNLIRAQETVQALKKTPIIALSDDELQIDKCKCRQVGMDSVLEKPASKKELITAMTQYLPS